MTKLFIFDIDDTLYDQQEAFEKAVAKIEIDARKKIDTVKLYQLMKVYGDETFSIGFELEKLRTMQVDRIQRALRDFDVKISDQTALNFQLNFEKYQTNIQFFPMMTELFDYLKVRQQKLGIITNGTLYKQKQKVDKLKLNKWIPEDLIVISETVGISKPERAIFEFFEQKLPWITKEDIYYIGDDYLNDVVGPKSVGWQSIWVNYRSYSIPDVCLADYVVSSPVKLYATIQNIVEK